MNRAIVLKMLLMLAISNAVFIMVLGMVLVVPWPDEVTVSSDLVAYPLAAFSTSLVFLSFAGNVWKRKPDGTYVENNAVRWLFVGLLLLAAMATILVTCVMAARYWGEMEAAASGLSWPNNTSVLQSAVMEEESLVADGTESGESVDTAAQSRGNPRHPMA